MPVLSKPVENGRGPVPYEVFLLVVDTLIAKAEACQESLFFWMYYQHRVPSKLAFIPSQDEDEARNQPLYPLKTRFRSIMLASQVNTKTRALVHKNFVRVPLALPYNDTLAPVEAWVVPHLDKVMVMPLITRLVEPENIAGFVQAISKPTPAGYAMLQHVQHLHLPSLACLNKSYHNIMAHFAKLPNLRDVFVSIGRYNKKHFEDAYLDSGLFMVNQDTFPDLQDLWTTGTAYSLHKTWRPYEKRGIKLYGAGNADFEKVMELIPKEGDFTAILYPPGKPRPAQDESIAEEALEMIQSLAL
ncbi:hypothetical protein CGCA056_v006496 [Colletotrichum aenigma]|uniref:uncharacterized protein n=1 Tax=Colletotrichum aenigma TaxID=1215731 RepID=UPI0018726358|nr:uncharacterized protein CGCA056_v006496 [Colletotrichum aenigma]KAF5521957.1 hypothetical protein CGCA056_v006496 [Colletotrichum aenigma]